MGIAFSYIRKMNELGLFGQGGLSILDIGSSNLYSASPTEIAGFLRKYGAASAADIEKFAERLAAGSSYDPVRGGLNEAFVGELFERAGMHYESLDIAAGYRTTIFDLNSAVLPPAFNRKFDLVINFGTTEHILNQLNCFRTIHDAVKVGGYIYHSLPAVGWVDHGYITYTGRCFFEMANYNKYELVSAWFDAPYGSSCILDSFESYGKYFPALKKALAALSNTEDGRSLRALSIPNIGINVIYRKLKGEPFRVSLESSTSVGAIPETLMRAYQGDHEPAVDSGSEAVSHQCDPTREANVNAITPVAHRVAALLNGYPLLYSIARRTYRTLLRK